MSKFQIILIGVFVVFIVTGVALFATFKNKDAGTALPPITIWGTFPSTMISGLVSKLNETRTTTLVVNYVEKSEDAFDTDFIEALARGEGPDAILIPQEHIVRHEDKLLPIPNTIITERDFKNTYIPQAELYLSPNREVLALPFTVDPLVMYWNRDIFTNAGIAKPPVFWDEFTNLTKKIDLKDVNSNIRRSAIAMGEFNNINNAREILGALLLQSGNPVTARGDASSGERVVSTIGDGQFAGSKSSTPAVTFYTQFANPRDPLYSWNRGLPMSKSWFLSGSLATYFGFASELFDLRSKNPNIDYDVAELPQPRTGSYRATYGSMYGFSIVRTAKNPTAVYTILSALTAPDALTLLNKLSNLPPVRRDMIAAGSTDPYQAIFLDSALISRGWLDTNAEKTSKIFETMVESITSGRAEVYAAIQTAHEALELSLRGK
jgi:ABC-type glycerol-3-phosphate transport system substrate-binding protein